MKKASHTVGNIASLRDLCVSSECQNAVSFLAAKCKLNGITLMIDKVNVPCVGILWLEQEKILVLDNDVPVEDLLDFTDKFPLFKCE